MQNRYFAILGANGPNVVHEREGQFCILAFNAKKLVITRSYFAIKWIFIVPPIELQLSLAEFLTQNRYFAILGADGHIVVHEREGAVLHSRSEEGGLDVNAGLGKNSR